MEHSRNENKLIQALEKWKHFYVYEKTFMFLKTILWNWKQVYETTWIFLFVLLIISKSINRFALPQQEKSDERKGDS